MSYTLRFPPDGIKSYSQRSPCKPIEPGLVNNPNTTSGPPLIGGWKIAIGKIAIVPIAIGLGGSRIWSTTHAKHAGGPGGVEAFLLHPGQGAPTGREGDQGTALRLVRIALLRWGSTGLQSPGLQQQDDASSWSTILLDGLDLWHPDPLGLGPSVPHTLNHRRDHGQTRTSDIDHGTDVHTVFLGVRDRAKIYFT